MVLINGPLQKDNDPCFLWALRQTLEPHRRFTFTYGNVSAVLFCSSKVGSRHYNRTLMETFLILPIDPFTMDGGVEERY